MVVRLAVEARPALPPECPGILLGLLLEIPLETLAHQVLPVFLESLRQVPALEKIPYVIAPFNV